MLKIKDNVDLKELEKYGFIKLENDYRGHKYSWKEEKGNWFYELYVAKDNRLSIRVISEEVFSYIVFYGKLQTKLYDLIKADLVEKVD